MLQQAAIQPGSIPMIGNVIWKNKFINYNLNDLVIFNELSIFIIIRIIWYFTTWHHFPEKKSTQIQLY